MTRDRLVTGQTRVVFVIADPVAQLRTPQAQNPLWQERGVDLVTVPAHVPAEGLATFFPSMRVNRSVAGAVVTVPHKQTAASLCDRLGATAGVTAAVNAIRRDPDGRLIGETFDGDGFVVGLRSRGIDPGGRRVRLVGAGGAASAIGVALARAGVESLRIENRTDAHAEVLVERIRTASHLRDVSTARVGEDDLIVNATSLGMRPDDVTDFRFERMAAGAIAADVIVSDEPTPFLAAAAASGLSVHEGRYMLQGQMALIADFLVGG
jgi:shikimate dehydrogenase